MREEEILVYVREEEILMDILNRANDQLLQRRKLQPGADRARDPEALLELIRETLGDLFNQLTDFRLGATTDGFPVWHARQAGHDHDHDGDAAFVVEDGRLFCCVIRGPWRKYSELRRNGGRLQERLIDAGLREPP